MVHLYCFICIVSFVLFHLYCFIGYMFDIEQDQMPNPFTPSNAFNICKTDWPNMNSQSQANNMVHGYHSSILWP